MRPVRILLIGLIAFASALAGVFAARWFAPVPHPPGAELHAILHHGLDLDARQQAQLEALEQQFALKKQALEMELRADNARLAAAIEAEHGAGPRVREAVDRSHAAMGALQKETLGHVFAMRGILRPEQAAKFDKAVVKALTAEAR
ncbi:periplasmic heavy metal sensor [Sphingomonas psychrotolerans]|uniref:Periplasmic heavy metal sensor n=1 Tax=Sphingomonas psychrotolerans TaxID=1327635 RepID=A0ABU3N7L3_9SPHN|nr:periplasmic heavy metal sensor [Sphingomonas psychrotolerans]MDT8760512.1 periplasmic heavy metal sensor [Sphingomonas psychrotolerans]